MEGDSFREEERRAGELVELDRDNVGSEPEPVVDFWRACSSAIRESMAPLSRCGQVSSKTIRGQGCDGNGNGNGNRNRNGG